MRPIFPPAAAERLVDHLSAQETGIRVPTMASDMPED